VSLYLLESYGNFSLASSAPAVTQVTYAGGTSYQGNSGGFDNIYQLDYPVNITAGSVTFDFAIVGDSKTGDLAYLHASNADLSESTQQGSDDHVYAWVYVWDIDNPSSGYDLQEEYPETWDKGSDFNVQVFGEVIPEPTTVIIWTLLGGLGIAIVRWQRRQKAA
jgi:hypothetical protein